MTTACPLDIHLQCITSNKKSEHPKMDVLWMSICIIQWTSYESRRSDCVYFFGVHMSRKIPKLETFVILSSTACYCLNLPNTIKCCHNYVLSSLLSITMFWLNIVHVSLSLLSKSVQLVAVVVQNLGRI